MERKSKGRQKVEMVKMPNESNLQVTFSKRRSGLFKKASELCTLCGAEVAIVVFSPGKKVFSFGHPSVETVIDRYTSNNPARPSPTMQLIEAHRNAAVRELNVQLSQITTQVEMEKKRAEEINQLTKAGRNQFWWEQPREQLNFSQLKQMREAMLHVRENITKEAEMILIQHSHPHPQFFGSVSGPGSTSASSSNQPMQLSFDNMNAEGFNPDMSMIPVNNNQGFNITQGFNNLGFGRGFF
ncbi:MADS-box transcription factor family protein [Euphorbia peplus]|nr:MADS-box transcription factor family protein [Euphorbia peplus]